MTAHKRLPVLHARNAEALVSNPDRLRFHDQALWFVRAKRDRAALAVPEWERLRTLASEIKAHAMSALPYLLDAFCANATRLGAVVHWARTAEEHNQIVLDLLQTRGARRVVKSKSMLTEECHLNPFLEANGIDVVDTDLGERIVQLRGEPPSHIVLPAIHLKKEDVGDLFHQHVGTPAGVSDPQQLTEAARQNLRAQFLGADAAITGVNFAIAETGGIVVCTNEGNADLGAGLPPLHIACMGLEKVIPRAVDLGVFIRLLARSATGQPITTYTSHFHGPRPAAALHIVIVDNGRTALRAGTSHRRALSCIRCGACLNTCPVYRRSGGHSYENPVPGPIGSILAAATDGVRNQTLPFACSLCGSCTDVCPVKIDLHPQLLHLRQELSAAQILPAGKRFALQAAAALLQRPWLYRAVGRLARVLLRRLPRWALYARLNAWGRARELPPLPRASFRELYARRTRSVIASPAHARPTAHAEASKAVAAPTKATPIPRTGAQARLLRELRSQFVPAAPIPALDGPWITFENKREAFAVAARAVGGEVIEADSRAAAHTTIANLPVYKNARVIVSAVHDMGRVDRDLSALHSGHALADVDLAIIEGTCAVAETGAVWIDDRTLPQRVLPFLCQHLVLVVSEADLVDDMHTAYASRDLAARPYGGFIAGPSKTADIEQALVIGAHGARSLTVVLIAAVESIGRARNATTRAGSQNAETSPARAAVAKKGSPVALRSRRPE